MKQRDPPTTESVSVGALESGWNRRRVSQFSSSAASGAGVVYALRGEATPSLPRVAAAAAASDDDALIPPIMMEEVGGV